MRKQKTIHTALEIKGVLFLVEEAKKKFPSNTVIGKKEFDNISSEIEGDYKREYSSSSVRRIFKLKEKPHPLSYEKLDGFTVWCFDNLALYPNFRVFLKNRQQNIEESDLISENELNIILEFLNNDSKTKIVENKPLVIKLDSSPFELQLTQGSTQKLLKEIAHVTGDLLKNYYISNPEKLITQFRNPRIKRRIELQYERQQKNMESIVAKAIKFARIKEASNEPVDPDWVVEFFNLAQDCTHENMQYLWAKLLASEIGQPNSISRRTLSIIKLLEPKEAMVFTKLCNCIWNLEDTTEFKEKILIKDMYMEEEYSDEAWDFDSMFIPHLEAIGLVSESFIDMKFGRSYNLDFFGKKHAIKSSKQLSQLEITALTRAGKEVFNIINPTPNKKYYDFTINYFKKVGILES